MHKNIYSFIKYVLLSGILFAMTLLLLETPQKLFETSDARLLEESGGAAYELKMVENDTLLFSEKLKVLVNSESMAEFRWKKFNRDELVCEEVTLAAEMDILLGGMFESIVNELREGKLLCRGFAAEVCCDIDETEYVWEIGMLTFESMGVPYNGVVIYDFDTKKIFYLELFDGSANETDIGGESTNLFLKSVVEYYEGLDVQWEEATVQLEPVVTIFPAYLEAFQNDVLFSNLIEAYDKLLAEEEESEIFFD